MHIGVSAACWKRLGIVKEKLSYFVDSLSTNFQEKAFINTFQHCTGRLFSQLRLHSEKQKIAITLDFLEVFSSIFYCRHVNSL